MYDKLTCDSISDEDTDDSNSNSAVSEDDNVDSEENTEYVINLSMRLICGQTFYREPKLVTPSKRRSARFATPPPVTPSPIKSQ